MKAMIFAAGLGTRLRPLTFNKPKVLVEVKGVTLLEISIRRLIEAGCREIIVNVHHFPEQIIDFLERKNHFDIRIAISHEGDTLLDTGGGLKKAAWFFDDNAPFLVCNADVLTNLDLGTFYHHHLRSQAIATLAIRRRQSSRYFLFDHNLQLQGWQNASTGEVRPVAKTTHQLHPATPDPWAFSGIHAISPAIFDWMPPQEVFSIVDVYLAVAGSRLVAGYPHDDDFWMDAGKLADLELAEQLAPAYLKGIL